MTGITRRPGGRWWPRRTNEAPPTAPPRTEHPDGRGHSDLLRFTGAPGDLATPDGGPVLVHALDGFLSAGQAGRLAAQHLLGISTAAGAQDSSGGGSADSDSETTDLTDGLGDVMTGTPLLGEVVAELDVDRLFDYRARRPPLAFDQDHYAGYEAPRLDVRRLTDAAGTPFLLLAGPEPDYGWEGFAAAVREIVETFGVRLVVGVGAVPMGVPHTRPIVVTAHATRAELVDRPNLWTGRLLVPASAQALLELRLGQWGHDAMGYVAHVPHYVSQVEFPPAAVTLLEAAGAAAGLTFDLDQLRVAGTATLGEVDRQVSEQEGDEVLGALEQQYDAFSRGAGQSMLARDDELPSADELGQQFEQFLAGLDHREGRD